jgi:uncharacterized protein DUF2868
MKLEGCKRTRDESMRVAAPRGETVAGATASGERSGRTARNSSLCWRPMSFALLGKLLDIEWMLRRDEERPSEDVVAHDRALLGQVRASSAEAALDAWVAARREELGGRTLGTRVYEILTGLHAILIGAALLAGAGTAKVLLHGPSAQEPTNVLHFLFATLVWPLALLLGSVCLLTLRGRLGRSVLLEDMYLVGVGALGRLSKAAPEGDGWEPARQWRALRRSARRYGDLEVGTLLSAAQWYPLAFHLGAAFALAGSALASDLAFAWSTTNDSLEPATLAAVFRVAAAPWCATLGVGCVSEDLVAATQFSRFAGGYVLPRGAAISGAWWPVLFGCLLLYGVLPRLVFATGLAALVRRRSARLGERVLELRGRLYGVTVHVSRSHEEPDGAPAAPSPAPASARAPGATPCWVIGWRGARLDEAMLDTVSTRLGLRAERRDAAGDGEFEQDEALLRCAGSGLSTVLLLVDGWEAPDKATRRFIEALRAQRDRPVFVGVLLDAEDAPALAIWRDRLGLLADPGLSVAAIVTGAAPGSRGVSA